MSELFFRKSDIVLIALLIVKTQHEIGKNLGQKYFSF